MKVTKSRVVKSLESSSVGKLNSLMLVFTFNYKVLEPRRMIVLQWFSIEDRDHRVYVVGNSLSVASVRLLCKITKLILGFFYRDVVMA